MKIASQLLNPTPNAGAKISAAPESESTFHGALTAAAQTVVTSSGRPHRGEKPETVESKKKNVASGSPANGPAVSMTPASQLLMQDQSSQLTISQPVSGVVPEPAASETFTKNPAGTASKLEANSPSFEPVTPAVDSAANVQSANTSDPMSFDGSLDLAAVPASPAGLEAASLMQQNDRNRAISLPNHSTIAAQPGGPTATHEAVTPKTSDAQITWESRLLDGSDSAPVVDAAYPSLLAEQQRAAAIDNSVAVPALLPNLSAVTELQTAPTREIGKSINVNGGVGSTKEGASRQVALVARAKSAAPSFDSRSKTADDDNREAEVTDVAAPTSFVKILDTSGTANHGTTDSKISLDAAALQQPTQTASSSGSNHITPATQASSASPEFAAQITSSPMHPDALPMQGVTSAQLTQSMRSSEMKLGMQSAEFGNISISTSLNHQAISAQISIDHSELGKALALHLPAIEEKLGSAYGVQAKVELRESNNPSSPDNSGYSSSGQQSRQQRQGGHKGTTGAQSAAFEPIANHSSFTATSVAASASRLDIRI